MATIPKWLVGRHLTSVVITPVTVGTDGTITDVTASAFTMTTLTDGLTQSLRPVNEEINPVNATRENFVHIIDGHYLSFTQIKRNDGNDPDGLLNLILNYDHFKFAYTEGTSGSAKTVTGYGLRNEHSTGIQGRGKQVATLALDPVDAGTASFARS